MQEDQPPYDEDHPEVIRANTEARCAKAEARRAKKADARRAKLEARRAILEGRAKLSPVAQTVYAMGDVLDEVLGTVGCFLVITIIVIALLSPLLPHLFAR